MQTVVVLLVVLFLGAVGGAISRLMSNSAEPQSQEGHEKSARYTRAVRISVESKQGVTVTDGQVVPSILVSALLGMAAAFLLYAQSFGDKVVLVIGGETSLTLSTSQCALALIGGLGGAEIIKRLVAEKTRDNALKAKQAEDVPANEGFVVKRYLA
jgi:hypothetical protein